jgi:uncharacterized protein (DUF885 family)
MRRAVSIGILAATLLSSGCGPATEPPPPPPAGTPDARFEELTRRFLDWHHETHPVRATGLGVHEHDSELPDLSRAAIARVTTEWRGWLAELETIDRTALKRPDYHDYRVLEYAMRAALLELEEVGGWRRNPMLYNRTIANGIASLIDREFEALERQGIEQVDASLVERLSEARTVALERLQEFADWLERDLLPRADGDFRLGPELFRKKLLYEEHIDRSIEELRAMNETAILEYQEWVAREARRIDADRPPAEVMDGITRDHPSSDRLIPTAAEFVTRARDFVVERQIVTLPSDRLPTIRPTPAYARSGFASMSTPGPFETVATEAYYNITNVDEGWTPEEQEQHLTYFNYSGLLGISVHEVMPGHYVQLLVRHELPSDIRKVFAPSSLVEGWAHYAEQMMIDEGLGDDDPEVRLGQLRRALQRHARWHAALALHAGDASVEQASERFQEIAFFAPFPALRETRRATYNPTYLYYALGRMEIFRLREDYRRHLESRGRTYSLREFHDRLLRLGLPLPMAREIMLGR